MNALQVIKKIELLKAVQVVFRSISLLFAATYSEAAVKRFIDLNALLLLKKPKMLFAAGFHSMLLSVF